MIYSESSDIRTRQNGDMTSLTPEVTVEMVGDERKEHKRSA